jgi:regulator of cell morphogenesis and NO signaling
MNELLSRPLSHIVNEQHQAAFVFEKYNLDYCCHGSLSLQQACDDNDIQATEIIEELRPIYAHKKNELDFDKIKLYQLADYILYTHHSYIKREMPLILTHMENVLSKQSDPYQDLQKISALLVDLFKEISHHMHQEETVIFPGIKLLEQNSLEILLSEERYFDFLVLPIIDNEEEHEDVTNMMREIKKLAHNYVAPANADPSLKLLYSSLRDFETDLHRHVNLENNILFPKALILEKEAALLSK